MSPPEISGDRRPDPEETRASLLERADRQAQAIDRLEAKLDRCAQLVRAIRMAAAGGAP